MKRFLADVLDATTLLSGFVRLLRRCPTSSDRKALIIAAHSHGALTDDETGALITGLMLEVD